MKALSRDRRANPSSDCIEVLSRKTLCQAGNQGVNLRRKFDQNAHGGATTTGSSGRTDLPRFAARQRARIAASTNMADRWRAVPGRQRDHVPQRPALWPILETPCRKLRGFSFSREFSPIRLERSSPATLAPSERLSTDHASHQSSAAVAPLAAGSTDGRRPRPVHRAALARQLPGR